MSTEGTVERTAENDNENAHEATGRFVLVIVIVLHYPPGATLPYHL